jgi:DNA-directed RNA polymerase subunit H
MADVNFNALEHELVPEHFLLAEEEVQNVLKEMKITKDQLPKIRKSDACIRTLEKIYGTAINEGKVVKIVRRSTTAESFVIYRLVVRG